MPRVDMSYIPGGGGRGLVGLPGVGRTFLVAVDVNRTPVGPGDDIVVIIGGVTVRALTEFRYYVTLCEQVIYIGLAVRHFNSHRVDICRLENAPLVGPAFGAKGVISHTAVTRQGYGDEYADNDDYDHDLHHCEAPLVCPESFPPLHHRYIIGLGGWGLISIISGTVQFEQQKDTYII